MAFLTFASYFGSYMERLSEVTLEDISDTYHRRRTVESGEPVEVEIVGARKLSDDDQPQWMRGFVPTHPSGTDIAWEEAVSIEFLVSGETWELVCPVSLGF